ncbi:hypothetical protein Aoki45_07810 [Algoriphagus sp. oki45]|uniref:TolB family protein n=1 Tax=Algoriphagus sp. oki45 TaxID=3067294 RepID=UPI0027FE085B|nr:hypothetical protein Aoki45_07810 [Algoriphagus sp. oki45]
MKKSNLDQLFPETYSAPTHLAKSFSKISSLKKGGRILVLLGVLFVISCDNEDQNPAPPVNEPDPTGTIVVKINTVGKDDDPNGYNLIVEGSANRQVGPREEVTISNKKVGRYSIELSGISNHCTGTGNMVREVNVTTNGTATVEFEVDCKAILRDRIAYSKGTVNFTDFKFYSSKLDGTDEKVILDKVILPFRMAISPDGTKIAFSDRLEGTTIQQIYIMDVDGENLEMIPFEPNENPAFTSQFLPVWHPDGKKLTFRNAARTVTYDMETGQRTVIEFDPGEIFVASQVIENGSKFLGTFLISRPGEPVEQKIASINLDGSGLKYLKEGSNLSFTTPLLQGNKLTYIQRENVPGVGTEVWQMNSDGTEDQKINNSLGFSVSEVITSFSVSPDGSEYIFAVSIDLNNYLAKSKLNGTPQAITFNSTGVRSNPVWSPITRD